MKEILINYTQYNVWANKLILASLTTLTDEEVEKDLGGSFPSIRRTVEHSWFAESIWLQRLQMVEQIVSPALTFSGNFNDACAEWLKISEDLQEFCEKIYDDRGLEHQFHYTNIQGEHCKSKVWECLQHVCNHSTFHRGQLIIYLRQLGKTKIPSTDFIKFSRSKK